MRNDNPNLLHVSPNQMHSSRHKQGTPSPVPSHIRDFSSHIRDSDGSFFTNPSTKLTNQNIVISLHQQLNNLIDQLNDKVERVIQRHEGEFLTAYRTHIKKIRRQLDEYRVSAHKYQTSGQQDVIRVLEKESVLLRDELSKMFEKLELKNHDCERLKLRCSQLEKQNKFMEEQVKKLMRKLKRQTAPKNILEKSIQTNSMTLPMRPVSNCDTMAFSHQTTSRLGHSKKRSSIQLDGRSIKQQISQLVNNDKQLSDQLYNIYSLALQQRDIKYNTLRDKCYLYTKNIERNIQTTTTKSQLQSFFLQCVEAVRRDNFRKKAQKSLNITYNQICMDFQEFKKQDKTKILEKFLNNEEIIKTIFEITFKCPVRDNIKTKKNSRERLRSLRVSMNYNSKRD